MRRAAGPLCLSLLLAGCGADARYAAESAGAASEAKDYAVRTSAPAGGEATPAADAPAVRYAAGEQAKPRIIYTADARVVAKDFAAAAEDLAALVETVGGYVADASVDRTSGSSRSGRWTVRVPVSKFDAFLAGLDTVGFVESRTQSSQDVTMEYVDVEARIANLERLEERFVTLLAERTGELEDVLKVEQELSRVRGDIEQAQGRLRYLANKTDFSTVTVAVREEKDYEPPKAPTFGERIAVTWSRSLRGLRDAGEAAVLAAVALAPWLAVAAVPAAVVVGGARRIIRRRP